MPLYEYECESCHHRFERIQKFSDPPVETCPTCGGPVRKLISSPAIQFKGTGWYITDYAKKSTTDAGQAGGGGSADKTEKSDASAAKSDSKSDSSTSSSNDAPAAKTAKPAKTD